MVATPDQPISRLAWRLAGTSALVLFLELAFIRFIAAEVKYFSYYANFVLLAAFLGTGIGLLAWRRLRSLLAAWPVASLALFGLLVLLANVTVTRPQGEHLWGIYAAPSQTAVTLGLAPTVLLIFLVLTVLFIPLGARVGSLFGQFKPLHAYAIDIGGALGGIVAFAVMSWAALPPLAWFAVAFVAELVLSEGGWRPRVITVAAAVICLALVRRAAIPGEIWSPYYRINLMEPRDRGFLPLNVNGSLHQYLVNFADSTDSDLVRSVTAAYRMPYATVENFDTVLVVGSGTGNDVALLLAMGAKYIDAVEIDPMILRLGRELHPSQPYADPRVHVHIDDARAFLRRTTRRYSVIVFGTLDSQTLLSGLSSLRLDNYVYTREAMVDARARLAEDGRLITYHASAFAYIAGRIYQNIYLAFESPPVAVHFPRAILFNIYIVGGVPREAALASPVPDWVLTPTRMATDNWPYLYLERPSIAGHYLQALAGVLVIALFGIGLALRGGGGETRFDGPMFCFGAGFLLLETKSVTEMALLFGSTWTVNVLVFGAILAVVLLANIAVRRGVRPRIGVLFAALLGSLALSAVVPVRALAGFGLPAQWALGSLLVALPVLFGALLFPRLLEQRSDSAAALGWNVLGAIVGGVLEYSSMLFGIKVLYLLAALTYLAALALIRRGARAVSA